VDDDDLREQLKINMDKAKEFLENFNNINQDIRNYSVGLNLKYDEFGKKNPGERESLGNTTMSFLLDKIVSLKSNFEKKTPPMSPKKK